MPSSPSLGIRDNLVLYVTITSDTSSLIINDYSNTNSSIILPRLFQGFSCQIEMHLDIPPVCPFFVFFFLIAQPGIISFPFFYLSPFVLCTLQKLVDIYGSTLFSVRLPFQPSHRFCQTAAAIARSLVYKQFEL